jgi:hypothetical protein
MSYPTIGMPGIVPGNKWTPKTIEKLLRNGVHVFVDGDGDGTAAYNAATKRFEYTCTVADGIDPAYPLKPLGTKPFVKAFATFLELATWLAFMGKDFL